MARPGARRRQIAIPFTIPAPTGGWNARDPWDSFDPMNQAIVLDNWFPYPGYCQIRRGSQTWCTGVGSGWVETIAPWAGPASTKMIAAGGGGIYDVTTTGAAVLLGSGFTSNRWQATNYKSRLFLASGADAPQTFDGTTLAPSGFTGPGDVTKLISPVLFRNRMYFAEVGSSRFWYGGTGNVTGTLTDFDLATVAAQGGYLMAIGVWTRDGGSGADDLIVFMMSTGEALIYQGSDPGDIANWNKVGNFVLGEPIGRRCLEQYGADLLVLTKLGAVELSTVLPNAFTEPAAAMTDMVQPAFAEAARFYSATFGWQPALLPEGFLLINYPLNSISTSFAQFAMNLQTKRWCRFRGFNARCWGRWNGKLFYGAANGAVVQVDTGENDDGRPISFEALTGFSNLGIAGRSKQITLVRPTLSANATVDLQISTPTDYDRRGGTAETTSTASQDTSWDQAQWDQGRWSDALTIDTHNWGLTPGVGYNVAVRLVGSTTSASVQWFSTDIHYIAGSAL